MSIGFCCYSLLSVLLFIYLQFLFGFPELFDGHWCYLLKDCGIKFLIIPTTSLKETSSTENEIYYYDIEESGGTKFRLRFDEIRMVDKLRIITKEKPYRNVATERKIIEQKFLDFLSFTVDTSKE